MFLKVLVILTQANIYQLIVHYFLCCELKQCFLFLIIWETARFQATLKYNSEMSHYECMMYE